MSFSFQARAKYLHVAKQMKAYEDQLYEQWKESVEHILPGLLRRNLLVKPTVKEVAPEEIKVRYFKKVNSEQTPVGPKRFYSSADSELNL